MGKYVIELNTSPHDAHLERNVYSATVTTVRLHSRIKRDLGHTPCCVHVSGDPDLSEMICAAMTF
jgi:hypothetical protein